ncbi:phospholipase [Alkalibacillus silvisoli]|uniref:Phospholipase A2-like domain-containing protein n=1 Tax=Alkalibacillus silvisoli TaxID=392823 RepID=A0ABN0ZY35_9BACI
MGFCLLGYRYCGPGCSGPGAPVNRIDRACKAHDDCYRRRSHSKKQCDEAFIRRLDLIKQQSNYEGRHARLIRDVMSIRLKFYW